MLKTTSDTAANKDVKEDVKEEKIVYEFSYVRANPYANRCDVPTWTPVKSKGK